MKNPSKVLRKYTGLRHQKMIFELFTAIQPSLSHLQQSQVFQVFFP